MTMKKIAVRSMIRAGTGNTLIAFDLSQAESWIVAFCANERNMKHALMYGDIHTETAGNALFHANTGCPHIWVVRTKGELWVCPQCGLDVTKLMRYVGKRYNHASAYRMGPERAAQVINKDSDKPPYFTVTIKQSKQFSESWHNYYNLKGWWLSIEDQLRRNRTIRTTYGRHRTFFAAWGNELFKEATAFEPQSTVADHFNGKVHPELRIPGGLWEVYKQLVKPYRDHKIINQSHDSAILEVPQVVAKDLLEPIMKLMKRPLLINNEEFTIPVDLEWGGKMERDGEGSLRDDLPPVTKEQIVNMANDVDAHILKRHGGERHPSSDSRFDAKRDRTVYYLSHPLAPDQWYTHQQNMDHVVHLIRLFYEEGWHVIAPYHTICLALPEDVIEYRIVGLEVDCNVCRKIGNVVLTGHRLSSGMVHEMEEAMACKNGGIIHNFIGYNDAELRVALRYLKDGGTLESDTPVQKTV